MIATALGSLALASCTKPPFACEGDDQCTLLVGGQCQADAWCSYPDPDCPSGHRYSQHAGPKSERCVDSTDPSTTAASVDSPDSSSTSSSSSEGGDPCEGVDCGPQGQCEPDGDQPACVCNAGFIDQDLTCVEGDCPGTTCVWVDAVDGDDAASGTNKDEPIRTLARAAELAPTLAPGEAMVLRRGQSWDEALVLTGLAGTEEEPIIVGAYGPDQEGSAAPLVGQGATIEASAGVQLQDLRITNPGGTALRIIEADHVTVLDCEAFEASTGCIHVRTGSTHTALVGNAAWSCGAMSFAVGLIAQGGPPGDHHWLVDNRVDGEQTINALNLSAYEADDVKAVRNYLRGSVDRGLHSRVGGHAWLMGNVVAQAGDANDAAFDHAGEGQVIVRGNLLIDATLPVFLNGRGEWAFNTVLHRSTGTAITVPNTANGWAIHDNLVITDAAPALAVAVAMDVVADRNVYGHGNGGDCSFDTGGMLVDLAGWQALGQDTRSRCEPVPGPSIPIAIGSTRDWDDEGLLDAAVPGAAWDGCGDPVGAFDCDGLPLAAGLPPFEDIGHGWPGPPAVQERVELVP